MCQDHRDDVTGSNEDKCCVPTEHGGIGKLKERTHDRRGPGRVRMCQDELVEMVDMRYTKVQRCEEDDARGRQRSQEVQRHEERAEQYLLRDGSSDVIAPANPAAEGFVQSSALDPVPPPAFNHGSFEKRTSEEESCQQEAFGYFDDTNRIPA